MGHTWITIGAVRSVNPARRTLRVEASPGHAHELEQLQRARVRLASGELKMYRVAQVTATEHDVLVTLAPGVTRDTVAAMRGAELLIEPAEQTARPEHEFELEELPGLRVIDQDGRELGVVRDAFATPAHTVLEIAMSDGQIILLPLIEQVVRSVDVKAGRLKVADIAPYAAVQDAPERQGDED